MCSPEVRVRVFSPILAALLFALTAFAHADALRADFAPLTLRPRTNAPTIFDITLHRTGAGLLEGVLEITFKSGNEVLLRQRTPDLTLTSGAQSFRIITPPLPPQNAYLGTDAQLRFVTKKDAIDLGLFPVSATSRAARNFVLAVCDTRAAGGRDLALWQSLRLESVLPSGANASNLIATSPAFLAPEDFPANPLAFFAFDLVLLDGSLTDIYRALSLRRTIHVQLANPSPELLAKIRALPHVASVDEQPDRLGIALREDEMSVEELSDALHALGARIRMFQPDAMAMETAFMKLTEGKTA